MFMAAVLVSFYQEYKCKVMDKGCNFHFFWHKSHIL